MSTSLGLSSEVVAYLAKVNRDEHPALKRCREETAALGEIAGMQISAEQGAFMALLARLIGARRAFEVGVFTGYSSLAVTLEMQAMHGAAAHLFACDVSREWTDKARAYWIEAGVADLIDLRIGPAAETLTRATGAGFAGTYDLGFIDADKTGYGPYCERGLELLRPGGLMLFDNVLWSGSVADPSHHTPDADALRAIVLKAKADARVHAVTIGIGDGLLMVIKR